MKRARVKKPAGKSEPTPRDGIGLRSAMDGDIHGATIFVSFVQRELLSLWLSSNLPERVRLRLKALGSDADRLAHYLQGFEDAKKQ